MSRATVNQQQRRLAHPQSAQTINFNSPVSIFDQVSFLRGFRSWSVAACVPLAIGIIVLWGMAAHAQEETTAADVQAILDNIFILIAAILVIFMNAGFGMLETGFCRQKNAVNVLSKNLIVFALATIAYWAIGFSLMYGVGNGFIGGGGWFLSSSDPATYQAYGNLEVPVHFLFQVAFAGTSATIVSGAVAERIKFVDFLIFSVLLVGIAYPISGHWLWGGGWLNGVLGVGFHDFAGSTIVHSVGGWAALIGAAMLGPRLGKYQGDQVNAIPGHNMSIAMLGCLILWIGWFGFNPGSELAADMAVPYIAVTTNLAAAAGCISATFTAWFISGKPDLSMIINGVLAGLVGITAGCYVVDYLGAIIIGLVAGVLVVFSVLFFDKIKIDDPVGAISVHLVNGVWGTLAVGLFANANNFTQGGDGRAGLFYGGGFAQLGAQIVGILVVGLFTTVLSFIFWFAIKSTLGLRVTEEEELIGLDIGEHGMEAYSGFLKESGSVGSSVSSSSMH